MKKKILSFALTLAVCLGLTITVFAEEDAWSCISIKASTEWVSLGRDLDALERQVFIDVVTEATLKDVNVLNDGTTFTILNDGGNYDIYVYLRTYRKVGPNETIEYNDFETDELITIRDAAGKYYAGSGVSYLATELPPWGAQNGTTPVGNGMYWIMDTEATPGSTNILLLKNGESVSFTLPSGGQNTLYALTAEYYNDEEENTYYTSGNFFVDTQTANTIRASQAGHSITPAVSAFADVPAGAYYEDAVKWAVEKNITSGTSKTTFSPSATCSKAQILTFLWRANGSPEPTAANPFTDIKSSDYFYKAALWAAEKGMVSGTTFGANTDCTRAMTVEYMWKAAGSPATADKASFNDVPANANYAQAVAWAVEQKITSGTGKNTFSPSSTCTRGQIVTFLYRALGQ